MSHPSARNGSSGAGFQQQQQQQQLPQLHPPQYPPPPPPQQQPRHLQYPHPHPQPQLHPYPHPAQNPQPRRQPQPQPQQPQQPYQPRRERQPRQQQQQQDTSCSDLHRRPAPPASSPNADLISRIHTSALKTPSGIVGLVPDLAVLHAASSDSASYSSDSDFAPSSRARASPQLRPPPTLPARPTRPAQHSRSASHPFPSLFSGRRKRQADGAAVAPSRPSDRGSDSDSTDAETPAQPPRQQAMWFSRRGGADSKNPNANPGTEYTMGHCMTCGTLVRWPKELDVFKCTVCLTVNDIGRPSREPAKARAASQGAIGPPPPTPPPGRATAISIDQTRRLIRHSIYAYLTRHLHPAKEPSHRPPIPPPPEDAQAQRPSSNPMQLLPRPAPSRNPPGPRYLFDEPPTLRANAVKQNVRYTRSFSALQPDRSAILPPVQQHQRNYSADPEEEFKAIFKPLEDYIITCFGSFDCVNSSFTPHTSSAAAAATTSTPTPTSTPIPTPTPAAAATTAAATTTASTTPQPSSFPADRSQFAASLRRKPVPKREAKEAAAAAGSKPAPAAETMFDLDPKLLLLGNFAENGLWWAGGQPEVPGRRCSNNSPAPPSPPKPLQMDWQELAGWYSAVINAAEPWQRVYHDISRDETFSPPAEKALQDLEFQLLRAQEHAQRVLLKATEMLLKRPGRPISNPDDLRFLLIVMENPLLRQNPPSFRGRIQPKPYVPTLGSSDIRDDIEPSAGPRLAAARHAGVVKRVLGLCANSSGECQNNLVVWFARYPLSRFVQVKDLVSAFLTSRLVRQNERGPPSPAAVDVTGDLVPNMAAGRSVASLHAAVGNSNATRKETERAQQKMIYQEDWQIRAAARVLALLFAANNSENMRRGGGDEPLALAQAPPPPPAGVCTHGQMVPTSDFYNTLLDLANLVHDFEAWESRRARFSFCQYPFLLSIGAKTQILEYDARRQMVSKARDAFFDSIMTRKNVSQFLFLAVRRDCLVEDSLKAVSEVIGSGSEDIKKGLRIGFEGEEGIDAGGLRKEWFLLLVREVFNPEHGMFTYDEDSQYCYFNPNSFETSDQFFLVGVVMGLAIYNSTILDVALPPFSFRKLLASAPGPAAGSLSSPPPAVTAAAHPRPLMSYTLEDLHEYRPRLAKSLRQLLEYEADHDGDDDETFESTFCLDFSIDVDKYGAVVKVPLCPGGELRPVTKANRREYVNLYVRYLLETAVIRQFEPFKRGFWTVCGGGSAISLFRPEEIELLIRGSDEALDISSLRAVAQYDNWRRPGSSSGSGRGGSRLGEPGEPGEPAVVRWFWQTFEGASPQDQRKLLSFITGSDRIPATGSLAIRLSCLGDDCDRYPIARTCFNTLSLWRYESQHKFETMLWRAVHESEGFGLK